MSSQSKIGLLTWQTPEISSSMPLCEGHYVIGSKQQMADIVVRSTKVSRNHVVLSVESGTVFVKDIGSKNPVKLKPENKVIPKETLFQINPESQYFRIGDVNFKINLYPQNRQEEIERESFVSFSQMETESMKRNKEEKKEIIRESSSEDEDTISIKSTQSIVSLKMDQN